MISILLGFIGTLGAVGATVLWGATTGQIIVAYYLFAGMAGLILQSHAFAVRNGIYGWVRR